MPLPPRELAACFRRCEDADLPGAVATGDAPIGDPVFDEIAVLDAQRRMILRIAPDAWRALLVLAAPVEFDPAVGKFAPPSADRAAAWRTALAGAVDDERMSCVAFYHPWVLAQNRVDGPLRELPPTPFAAGVIARRDLARGPHIAPANEVVRGIVAVTHPIDDATHAELAVSPGHVNLIRPFPGHGIQLWGARTLSGHATLRYLGARRCLSAIERRATVAFRRLVFEPNTPGLWFLLAQTMIGILTPVFEAGALAGTTPAEAFAVRCDDSINPPDQVELGRVLCEVSVALAATGELIVFRLRRADAAIVVEEAS
jgi:phage tail sheath protein FI